IDIAFADLTDYLSFGRRQVEMPDGPRIVNYVDLNESSEVDGTIITEVSQGKDGVKVKLADKMRALDFLAKNMGLLSFDVKERLTLERERLELSRPKETESREDKLDQYLEALQGMMADD
ncbi:terminase small subunit, partial [Turicibacter sanguinis]